MRLTVDEIIDIHTLEIWRHGKAEGIRDCGLLETLIEYRIRMTSNVFEEAAMVLYTIAVDHPFFDGNKRVAFLSAVEILKSSGYYPTVDNNEVISFILAVALKEKTLLDVEKWLRKNVVFRSDLTEPF